MIAILGELLTGTFDRLQRSKVSFGLWVLVILSAVAFPISLPFADKIWADNSARMAGIAMSVVMIAICWLILHVSWKLTRNFADYADRPGGFWPWVGWALLAYLPTIAVIIGLAAASGIEDYSYLQAMVFACLPSLSAPLLVHSTGRAIDATGPHLREVFSFWTKRYIPLVTAYLLITASATFLSEALTVHYGNENTLIDIVASLIYLPAMILGIALTVEAFHRVAEKSPV
jgi:hypothetical protein